MQVRQCTAAFKCSAKWPRSCTETCGGLERDCSETDCGLGFYDITWRGVVPLGIRIFERLASVCNMMRCCLHQPSHFRPLIRQTVAPWLGFKLSRDICSSAVWTQEFDPSTSISILGFSSVAWHQLSHNHRHDWCTTLHHNHGVEMIGSCSPSDKHQNVDKSSTSCRFRSQDYLLRSSTIICWGDLNFARGLTFLTSQPVELANLLWSSQFC